MIIDSFDDNIKESKSNNYLNNINLDKCLKNRSNYELMQEAFFIANELENMNDKEYNKYGLSVYIIGNKWLNKWKDYVYFNYYTKINRDKFLRLSEVISKNIHTKEQDQIENDSAKYKYYGIFNSRFTINNEKKYPGPIDNYDILDDNVNYYCLRQDVYQNKDYIIVNRKIWDYFVTIYGVFQKSKIERNKIFVINGKDNEIYINAKYPNFYIYYFRTNELMKRKVIKNIDFYYQTISCSYKRNILDLKIKIFEFTFGYSLSSKGRIWIYPKNNINSLINYINDNRNYRKNHKMYFPGYPLIYFNDDVQIEEIQHIIKDYIIIFEYSKNKDFLFIYRDYNDYHIKFRNLVEDINKGLNPDSVCYADLYDKLIVYDNYQKHSFYLSDYFLNKYNTDQLSFNYYNYSDKISKNIIDFENRPNCRLYELYIKEISIFKKNLLIVIDKLNFNERIIKQNCFNKSLMISSDNNKNCSSINNISHEDNSNYNLSQSVNQHNNIIESNHNNF